MIRENICYDYLSLTFSYIDHHQALMTFDKEREMKVKYFTLENDRVKNLVHALGYDVINATKKEYAKNGFKQAFIFGEHIELSLGGPENKEGFPTVQLLMTGEACREFERDGGDWVQLRKAINIFNPNITRIDIAFDLFHNDYFTIDEIIKKIVNREFVSRSKKRSTDIELDGNNNYTKQSAYIGTLKSNTTINVYNKLLERRHSANIEIWNDVWNRIEVRYRMEKANTIWNILCQMESEDELPLTALGILKSTVNFITVGKDSNKRRANTWYKWNRFLRNVEKINIQNQAKVETTLDQKYHWLDKAVGKTASFLKLEEIVTNQTGYFDDKWNEFMSDKSEKFSEKDLKAFNHYIREVYGLAPITMEVVQEILFSNKNKGELVK